jgi:hypothetical protein
MLKISVPVLLAATLGLAGCRHAVATQLDRRDYLDPDIKKFMKDRYQCEDWKLAFEKTEKSSIFTYDYYSMEACGQKTQFYTALSRPEVSKPGQERWLMDAIPRREMFVAASKAQLEKTATFDLGCDELSYTDLNSSMAQEHTAYDSTIGVRGCGKQSTYFSNCLYTGYENGKHAITCQSVITSAGKNDGAQAQKN